MAKRFFCLINSFKSLPSDPAIPLIGVYPEETKTEKDTCTPMFTAVLFTIARTWKHQQMNGKEAGILLSHKKKNTVQSVLMKWMNLDPITQSEVSQKKIHIIY